MPVIVTVFSIYIAILCSVMFYRSAILNAKVKAPALGMIAMWSLPLLKGFAELFGLSIALTWLQAFTPALTMIGVLVACIAIGMIAFLVNKIIENR